MTSPRLEPTHALRSEALPKRNAERGRRVRAATDDRALPSHPVAGRHDQSSTPRASGLPRNLVELTVLVVEDDGASLEYFAFALRACGAVVVTASTALDGLRLVQEHRPDVVLSDIAMTGEDGNWLVRQIRSLADRATSFLPVVAATAYSGTHSRATALAAGFNDHLAKPIDPDDLCRAVARVAGR